MNTLSEAKVLGGIGSILVLLSAVPSIGWLLGIAGFVMVLLAVKDISQTFSDSKVYSNMLTAVVLAVGAIAVGAVTVIGTAYHLFESGSFVGSRFILSNPITGANLFGLVAVVIGGLLAVEALLVFSAVFVRRSFKTISSKLGIHTFETASLLFLIGAATAIIGIGFILIVISEILFGVSFFSIQDQPQSQISSPPIVS